MGTVPVGSGGGEPRVPFPTVSVVSQNGSGPGGGAECRGPSSECCYLKPTMLSQGVKLLSYLYQEALDNCSNEHYPVLLALLKTSCEPYTRCVYRTVWAGSSERPVFLL